MEGQIKTLKPCEYSLLFFLKKERKKKERTLTITYEKNMIYSILEIEV